MSKLRDWAGLPDGLLHSIVKLLGSFPNLLAFAATCHPWRSAFSSYPSKSTLYTLLPPLFLNPEVPFCSPRPFRHGATNTSVPNCPCYVIDLASQDASLCSQIPLPNRFLGASFGQMIFSSNRTCFLFDVFTGIEVSPPLLPVDVNTEIDYVAALTGPLASPNSHLIVSTRFSSLFWRVGSDFWSKCSPRNGSLCKFVVFKGQVFGMCYYGMLFMVHLTPQIHLQEIPVSWGGKNSMTRGHFFNTWLVVCGDMLLMVGLPARPVFKAYQLDTSIEPAKWVKVKRLEKWAIFISSDARVGALSCVNPERWGGRSNCVYWYDSRSGHLVACELGKPLLGDDFTWSRLFTSFRADSMVKPIWVVPSMFS